MTPTPKSASGGTARHDVAEQARPPSETGPFVLNLCSSTTPMALAKAEQPELKRFSFFVSRRFEEGRERFRLHMGYFNTLREAEEWLVAVRDIYPGAWAGEAPGKKLRERAVAAAAAQAQHAAGPPPVKVPPSHMPRSATVARNVPTLPVARPPADSIQLPAMEVPTIHAAPASGNGSAVQNGRAAAHPANQQGHAAAHPAAPNGAARNVPVARPVTVAPSFPPAARQVPPVAPRTAFVPATAPRAIPAPKVGAVYSAPSASAAPAIKTSPAPGLLPKTPPPTPLANARQAPPPRTGADAGGHAAARTAIAAAARAASATVGARSSQPVKPARPTSKQIANKSLPNSNVREVLKALDESPSETEITGETRMMPAPMLAGLDDIAPADNNFTDTQVLKFLETRRADGSELPGVDVETGAISLLKPDDTGTRRALKEAVTDNAPVWFAVQLQWSVQPVELSKVPPLAIFSAYTLYTVEGSRDGRKWFGLRLGFFSDAISAKQVAYYVRSEFNSVAVVPVSPQERNRASDSDKKSDTGLAFPKKPKAAPVDEFKLIDSDTPAAKPAAAAAKPTVRAQQATPASAKRNVKSGGNTVRARERRGPQTLEETLEILGAGELEMDSGSGETLNESGVRHLRVEVQKNTPFSRLLERLSERVRKP